MRLWPARKPRPAKRRCPFTCTHVATGREQAGTDERPRIVVRCPACGTTWSTWQQYLDGLPGAIPTQALPHR